jgi:hypothetical protein
LGFVLSDRDQFRGLVPVVTRRSVGDREELHGVARGGKLIGRAAELDLAIVRVCPDADDPHRIESCGRSALLSSSQRLREEVAMFVTLIERFCFQSRWDVLKSDRI